MNICLPYSKWQNLNNLNQGPIRCIKILFSLISNLKKHLRQLGYCTPYPISAYPIKSVLGLTSKIQGQTIPNSALKYILECFKFKFINVLLTIFKISCISLLTFVSKTKNHFLVEKKVWKCFSRRRLLFNLGWFFSLNFRRRNICWDDQTNFFPSKWFFFSNFSFQKGNLWWLFFVYALLSWS